MRDYAKVGGKVGRPGYRTPSAYLHKKAKELVFLYARYLKKSQKRLSFNAQR